MKKLLSGILVLALLLALLFVPSLFDWQIPGADLPSTQAPCTTASKQNTTDPTTTTSKTNDPILPPIDKDGAYNSKEDVALYIHTYGCLPSNYLTKEEARALGCSNLGRIRDYVKDGAIGGNIFYNREGLLPKKAGRTYFECDIDTWNKTSRGAKRIVYSSDGLIYYTDDHYNSFTLLYGEP